MQKEKFHRKTRKDILTAHCHAVFFTYNKAATDNYCKDISIFTFSNCHHLEWKGAVTILKWDQLRTIPDQFDLIWFTGLGGEDLNVNKLQLRPGEHKNNI